MEQSSSGATIMAKWCIASMVDDCHFEGLHFKIANQSVGGQVREIIEKKLSSLWNTSAGQPRWRTNLPDGWIILGDRGFLNDKERITVVGRGSQAILRGANVIYLALEGAPQLQCPGVAGALVTRVLLLYLYHYKK